MTTLVNQKRSRAAAGLARPAKAAKGRPKRLTREAILEMFRRRLQHSPDEEFQTALAQVMRIALFRLQDIYS